MIDNVTIFHAGGTVLWQHNINDDVNGATSGNAAASDSSDGAVPTTPISNNLHAEGINAFIREVLIEERADTTQQRQYRFGDHLLKWTRDNQFHLIIVAVYLNITKLLYIDDLIDTLKHDFIKYFSHQLNAAATTPATLWYSDYTPYNQRYQKILSKYQERYSGGSGSVQKQITTTQQQQQQYNQSITPSSATNGSASAAPSTPSATPSASVSDADDDGANDAKQQQRPLSVSSSVESLDSVGSRDSNSNDATQQQQQQQQQLSLDKPLDLPLAAPLTKRGSGRKPAAFNKHKKGGGSKHNSVDGGGSGVDSDSGKAGKKVKVMRQWDGQVSKAEAEKLDRSVDKPSNAAEVEQQRIADLKAKFFVDRGDEKANYSDDETADDDIDIDADKETSAASTGASTSWFGKTFTSMSKNISGLVSGRTVTADDLQPVVTALKQQLMSKNVAADIAEKLCDTVRDRLVGTRTTSFQTIRSVVNQAVDTSLQRILTPKKPVDLLQGIELAKHQRRPYVIVFVGVNGVGKSTSLSKVAAYLLSKGYRVGFAACDTFRAGAIEQLRTHATCLQVPLYAKGYDRDAASVAAEAIQSAKRDGMDVLLVDTAGRMQHNEPLMRALSKLIHLNKPDTVLFVGEALVGNDAVDQITEFNRSLIDFSSDRVPRLIDGIVLTKFDTIDDKVGAAISLTYTTGIPIVFVGTGQTYRDLKKLNVKTITHMLLK